MNLNIIINQSIKPFKVKLGRNERDVYVSPRSTAKFHLHQCTGVSLRPRTVKITDENYQFWEHCRPTGVYISNFTLTDNSRTL